MTDVVTQLVDKAVAAEPAVEEFTGIAASLKGLVTNAGASAELTKALTFLESAEMFFKAHFMQK